MAERLKSLAEALLGLVVTLVLWEGFTRALHVPSFILPSVSEVLAEGFSKAGLLWRHTVQTSVGTFLSLVLGAIFGVALGFLVGWSKMASRLLYPLLGAFNALPKSAFVPILVVWFGLGILPRVVAGFLIAFFPVVVNIVTGLNTIEPDLWDMLRSLGATKAQVYYKIGIPRTIPYFFAALKLAAAGAFIGNVVGEMFASGEGLGYVLLLSTMQMRMPLAFAALAILFLLGLVIFVVFEETEKVIAPWAYRGPEIPLIAQ